MLHTFSQGEYPAAVTAIRIIGIGSPFGDDQLGWYVADALKHSCYLDHLSQQQLSYIKTDRPGAGLVELLRGADLVILIDAMESGEPPGTVRRFEDNEIENAANPLSSHGFGVASALALAQALNDITARIILYGIEAHKMSSASPLPEVNKCTLSQGDINVIAQKIAADISLSGV